MGALFALIAGGCQGRDAPADGTATDTDPGTMDTIEPTRGDGGDGGDGDDTSGSGDTGPTEEPTACPQSRAPRQLRLLTRREYDATVHDLFGLTEPDRCSDDAQCPSGASCDGSSCVVQTVEPTAMSIPAQPGWSSVHLAGSFNGWPATVAAGGWALDYDAGANAWTGVFDIPAGEHTYKLVIDESEWIADPTNPLTADDGFGGSNSVLQVDGQTQVVPPRSLSFTRDLPLETRPEGYAFDNNAASGLVTSVHAEQFMRAAEAVAAFAVASPASWRPCDPGEGGPACARQVIEQVGRRAFRRPLTADEVDKFAAMITDEASVDDGLRVALRALLSSPYFVYRFELGEPQGDHFRLSGYEVATALSYGVWGTTPDDALLDAAEAGELDTEAGVEAQVTRLLADPRARQMLGTFGVQWLGVERLATSDKNPDLFPAYSDAVRAAALEETRRFVGHVAFESSGRFSELLDADYALVEPGLAAIYGVAPPAEPWGSVTLPPERRGLLGHASVLGSYAHSDQTSPVRRGLFVRRALLCQELPPPPPDAGGVPEVDPDATTRERFSQHMDDDACSGCHQLIDLVGFGFEHFDPVGAWRELDAGQAIDASGELRGVGELGDQAGFDGLVGLSTLLAGTEAAPACFARHYFRFAHGRHEQDADQCELERLASRFAEQDHDIVGLVVTTLTSPQFRLRR